MKQLMTGDEAIARGAFEAGVNFASAYPGTPSTEIMENLSTYAEIDAEWAPNEKVAIEAAIGASVAGARSMASMKHVGLNVAADPLMTWAYQGVNGGALVVTADEPGMFSSQNEQDNRNYAKMGRLPMLEPSDSQECKEMAKMAFDLSEAFDAPVLLRTTTRVCHSKSVVELEPRKEVPIKRFEKNAKKYVCVPANARTLRVNLEEKVAKMAKYSETTPLNFEELHSSRVGVITSGICYHYAKEIFGNKVSYLKLGFTYPLPVGKIKNFCMAVDTIYVIEEDDPYIEEQVRLLGFDCFGKNLLPAYGEMTPDVLRKAILKEENSTVTYKKEAVIARTPSLCAGCPHRGFFYRLGKKKNVMITGDIGCYTLAFAKPYNAMDTCVCMGASFSMGHGAQKVFNMGEEKTRVVAVLGDSTFFHTGINSLINTVYNNSNTISVILDNRITGMTGHQENPGTGYNAKGEPTNLIDIEGVVRSLGIKHIYNVDPNDLKAVDAALDACLALDEPSVIITRWPCVLKKFSKEDKEEFQDVFQDHYKVVEDDCIGCKICLSTGCPALSFRKEKKKSRINPSQCVGCKVCFQVCPKHAIVKEG